MTGSFGKPDATGRSSGKRTGRRKKLRQAPEGEAWVWLTRDLLESPAWNALSPNARKFIDFLLIEYMAHAGFENGALVATYDQLAEFGLSRRFLSMHCRASPQRFVDPALSSIHPPAAIIPCSKPL